MRKGLVGLSHLVGIIPLLDRCPFAFIGIDNLFGKLFLHRPAFFGLGKIPDPAQCNRNATLLPDLDGNLVGSASDAARLNLQAWAHIIQGLVKDLDGVRLIELLFYDFECAIDDFFGQGLLAFSHNHVDELGYDLAVKFRVR